MRKAIVFSLCVFVFCFSGCIKQQSTTINKLQAVTVGETASSKSLKITFDKAYCNKEIPSVNQSHYTAGEGKVYVVLVLEAENISDTSKTINLFGSKAYVDDYVATRSILLDVFGEASFDGSIDAGRKRKGYVAYEVDDNWNNFEFTLQDSPTGEATEFCFSVNRNQTVAN